MFDQVQNVIKYVGIGTIGALVAISLVVQMTPLGPRLRRRLPWLGDTLLTLRIVEWLLIASFLAFTLAFFLLR